MGTERLFCFSRRDHAALPRSTTMQKMITTQLALLAFIALVRPVESIEKVVNEIGTGIQNVGQKISDSLDEFGAESKCSELGPDSSFAKCVSFYTKHLSHSKTCTEFVDNCPKTVAAFYGLVIGGAILAVIVLAIIICCVVKCVC